MVDGMRLDTDRNVLGGVVFRKDNSKYSERAWRCMDDINECQCTIKYTKSTMRCNGNQDTMNP